MATTTKEVAKTVKSILDTQAMVSILDRSSDIMPTIDEVTSWWGYDLYSRNPGPAYKDGVLVGTDLDLACFLYALIDREAVINIPEYKSFRKTSVKEGEIVLSKENRHGKLITVISNKDTWTFSINVFDMNVMSESGVGAFRNFSITDMDGGWYSGWKTIQFLPSAAENKFIQETGIMSGPNKIKFNNFIHPNRWTSFFGHYYVITKALIDRLKDEEKHIKSEIKKILAAGIRYPSTTEVDTPYSGSSSSSSDTKSITINSFEAYIDVPDYINEYRSYRATQGNLISLTEKKKLYRAAVTKLQFMCRATEYAFAQDTTRFPAWIKNAKWETDYKIPGKQIKWNRLVLFQPEERISGQFQKGVSIRYRIYPKKEIVSINYKSHTEVDGFREL